MRKFLTGALCALFFSLPVGAQSLASQSGDTARTAIVYFYRVEEVDRFDRVKPKLYLGSGELAKMPENRFFAVRLSPWHHTISMYNERARIHMQFEAGKTYFIRVSRKRKGLDFKYDLVLTTEDEALSTIKGLQPLEDKYLKKRKEEIIKILPQNYSAQQAGAARQR